METKDKLSSSSTTSKVQQDIEHFKEQYLHSMGFHTSRNSSLSSSSPPTSSFLRRDSLSSGGTRHNSVSSTSSQEENISSLSESPSDLSTRRESLTGVSSRRNSLSRFRTESCDIESHQWSNTDHAQASSAIEPSERERLKEEYIKSLGLTKRPPRPQGLPNLRSRVSEFESLMTKSTTSSKPGNEFGNTTTPKQKKLKRSPKAISLGTQNNSNIKPQSEQVESKNAEDSDNSRKIQTNIPNTEIKFGRSLSIPMSIRHWDTKSTCLTPVSSSSKHPSTTSDLDVQEGPQCPSVQVTPSSDLDTPMEEIESWGETERPKLQRAASLGCQGLLQQLSSSAIPFQSGDTLMPINKLKKFSMDESIIQKAYTEKEKRFILESLRKSGKLSRHQSADFSDQSSDLTSKPLTPTRGPGKLSQSVNTIVSRFEHKDQKGPKVTTKVSAGVTKSGNVLDRMKDKGQRESNVMLGIEKDQMEGSTDLLPAERSDVISNVKGYGERQGESTTKDNDEVCEENSEQTVKSLDQGIDWGKDKTPTCDVGSKNINQVYAADVEEVILDARGGLTRENNEGILDNEKQICEIEDEGTKNTSRDDETSHTHFCHEELLNFDPEKEYPNSTGGSKARGCSDPLSERHGAETCKNSEIVFSVSDSKKSNACAMASSIQTEDESTIESSQKHSDSNSAFSSEKDLLHNETDTGTDAIESISPDLLTKSDGVIQNALQLSAKPEPFSVNEALPQDRESAINSSYGIGELTIKNCPERRNLLETTFSTPVNSQMSADITDEVGAYANDESRDQSSAERKRLFENVLFSEPKDLSEKKTDDDNEQQMDFYAGNVNKSLEPTCGQQEDLETISGVDVESDEKLNGLNIKPSALPDNLVSASGKNSLSEDEDSHEKRNYNNEQTENAMLSSKFVQNCKPEVDARLSEIGNTYGRIPVDTPCGDYGLDDVFEDRSAPMGTDAGKELDNLGAVFVHVNEDIIPCGTALSGQDEKSSVVEDSGFEDTDLLLDQESGIADIYSVDYKEGQLQDDNFAMSTASEGSLSPSQLDRSVTGSSFDSFSDEHVPFAADILSVPDIDTGMILDSGHENYSYQNSACFTDHSEEFVSEESQKVVLKITDLTKVSREPFRGNHSSGSFASCLMNPTLRYAVSGKKSFEQNLEEETSPILIHDHSVTTRDTPLSIQPNDSQAQEFDEVETKIQNLDQDLDDQKQSAMVPNCQDISGKSLLMSEKSSLAILSEAQVLENAQIVTDFVEEGVSCESKENNNTKERKEISNLNIVSGAVHDTVDAEVKSYAGRLADSLLLEFKSEITNSWKESKQISQDDCGEHGTRKLNLKLLKHKDTENLKSAQIRTVKYESSDGEAGNMSGYEKSGEVLEDLLTLINNEKGKGQDKEGLKEATDNISEEIIPKLTNKSNNATDEQICEGVRTEQKLSVADLDPDSSAIDNSLKSQEMLVDQTKRLSSGVTSNSSDTTSSSRLESGLFCVKKSYSDISGSVDSFYSGVSGSGDSFHSADDLINAMEQSKHPCSVNTVEQTIDSCASSNMCQEYSHVESESERMKNVSYIGDIVDHSKISNTLQEAVSEENPAGDLGEHEKLTGDENLTNNFDFASSEHPLPSNLFGEADFVFLDGDRANGKYETVNIHWNDSKADDSDEDEGNESFEDCSEESDDSFNPTRTGHSTMRHFVDEDDDDDEVFADCTDEEVSSDVSEKNDIDHDFTMIFSDDITLNGSKVLQNPVDTEIGKDSNPSLETDCEDLRNKDTATNDAHDLKSKGKIGGEERNVEISQDMSDRNKSLLNTDLSVRQGTDKNSEPHKPCQTEVDKIYQIPSLDIGNENSSLQSIETGELCSDELQIKSPRRRAFSTSMLDDRDFSSPSNVSKDVEEMDNSGMVVTKESQGEMTEDVAGVTKSLNYSKLPDQFDKEQEMSKTEDFCDGSKGNAKCLLENTVDDNRDGGSQVHEEDMLVRQGVCEWCERQKANKLARTAGFYFNSGNSFEDSNDRFSIEKCHDKVPLNTVESNSDDSLCYEAHRHEMHDRSCSSDVVTKQESFDKCDESYVRDTESRKDSGSDESSHSMDKDSLDEDDEEGQMSTDYDDVIVQSGRSKGASKAASDRSKPVATSNPPSQHEPPSSPLELSSGLESQNGSPPLCSLPLIQDNDPDLASSQGHVSANGSQNQENHSPPSSSVDHSMTLDHCHPQELDHAPSTPQGKKSKVKEKRWKEAEDAGSSNQKPNKKPDTPLHLDLACVDMAEVEESNFNDHVESPTSGLHRISSAGDFYQEEADSSRSHDPYRMLERSQSDASLLKKDLELLAQDDEVHLTAAESSSGQNISECNRVYLDLSRAEAFERVELGETSGNMMRTSSGRLLETIPQDEELKTVDLSYVYATHRSFSQESSSSVEDLSYSKGKGKDGCSGKYKCSKTSQDSSSISSKSNLKSSFQIYSHSLKQKVRQLQMGSLPEQLNALSELNVLMEQAWSMPIYGKDLAYELCDILRTESALDIIVSNLASNNRDLMKVSARLLEQSLTTSNRRQVAENGLELVVKMTHDSRGDCELAQTCTGILESLFKTSEDTCAKVIKLGGLDVITYWCRCSDRVTLKNCAIALSNLALYGGGENQQEMAKHKVPEWLFPLAFVEDDSVRYYALLAIGVMVSNKEIENAVMSSGTLALVLPFIDTHDPAEFAQRDMSHRHGRSPGWLKRLIPVLSSKREEAQALAAFHFVMEAGIKSEQGRKEVLYKIGAVDPLKWLASTPNRVASKLAAQALQIIGEEIPHKLSQQVPLWTCDDVVHWIAQVGFGAYTDKFKSAQVDGDLLLQLTEDELRDSLNMPCAITRKRFLRELRDLKISSDYTSCDPSMLGAWLREVGEDMSQYTYQMLYSGLDRPLLRSITDTHLTSDCRIRNGIHRMKIMAKIEELKSSASSPASANYDSTDGHSLAPGLHKPPIDVFISYRRSNGSQLASTPWNIDGLANGPHTNKPFIDVYISYRRQDGCKLASLLKVHLQLRGFTVFIDIEKLRAGKFDEGLLESVRQAKNFIIVLTPNSLDRCMGDDEKKDWVHREITAAIDAGSNIIPLIDNFKFPPPDSLPEDMRNVLYFNAVRWIHDYQDACVDKLEQFLRGEPNPKQNYPANTISSNHINSPPKQSTASFESPNSPPYQRAQGMSKTASVDSPDS